MQYFNHCVFATTVMEVAGPKNSVESKQNSSTTQRNSLTHGDANLSPSNTKQQKLKILDEQPFNIWLAGSV